MILNDLRLLTGRNGCWIALPALRQVDRDGQPRTDANGKPIYSPVVEFADRATADRFRDLVLDALRASHPEAFDDEGAP